MARVYLSLGSNVGDREAYLRAAIKILKSHKDIEVLRISSVYETEPEGKVDQRKFYNLCLEVETPLSPKELLKVCQLVEDILGRERKIRWGPRTVDVDILLYDQKRIEDKKLTIPHRRMKERLFVLIPLAEIAPYARFPEGDFVSDYLKEVTEGSVKRVGHLEGV